MRTWGILESYVVIAIFVKMKRGFSFDVGLTSISQPCPTCRMRRLQLRTLNDVFMYYDKRTNSIVFDCRIDFKTRRQCPTAWRLEHKQWRPVVGRRTTSTLATWKLGVVSANSYNWYASLLLLRLYLLVILFLLFLI